jgi:hypothetical protein
MTARMLVPVLLTIGAMALPLAWHAIADHRVHLLALRRIFPDTHVPETAHQDWWDSLPRRHQIGINAAFTAFGGFLGLAWLLYPPAAEITGALAALTGLAVMTAHRRRHAVRAGGL